MKKAIKVAKMVASFGSYALCCFAAGISLGTFMNIAEED